MRLPNGSTMVLPGSGFGNRDCRLYIHFQFSRVIAQGSPMQAGRTGQEEKMKALKTMAVLLMLIFLVSTSAMAQKRVIKDTSYIDRVQSYMVWLKDVIEKMSLQLEESRKDQDMMKIECIEKRLVDLEKLAAEIQASYKVMRGHSFNKKVAAVRQEFTLIDQKRKIAEQLVRLVNDCLGKTFHDGFTETVEEFFGWYDEDDPTDGRWENFWPEPLPPVYEPRPASLAENE
jgi:hypothetical protein